jgi:uncharacterized phage protein (TIGR02218 family)
MSYATFEESNYSAQPLELYRFSLGNQQWLFTSADHEVAYGADLYQPIYIRRSGFSKGGDGRKATMEIEVNAANDVALLYRTGWLTGTLIVTVYRHHYGDSDFAVLWKGRVTGCKWAGSVATLASDSASTLFQRAGLRRMYQVGCPHVLYSAACGLAANDWDVAGAVTAVDGKTVTLSGISAYGSGYFLGGMLKFGDELRLITAHSGNVVTLVDSVADLVVGATVTLWPGCSRTVNACKNKFSNLINYGGLPYLPAKNPFSGDALI